MIATLEENNSSSLSLKILDQLSQLFKSIITNSIGSPLHVIIVSDVNSKRQIRYEGHKSFDCFDTFFLRYTVTNITVVKLRSQVNKLVFIFVY